MGGGYTYDDKAVVRENPRIRTPGQLPEIFTTSYFGGPRGTGSAYRPLLLASYAVQWWIHGDNVAAFHVVNVVVHLGVTLLLFSLLLEIGIAPAVALATALLFAVHPIHVEAVTSLVGRGETLAALFVLLYLHAALGLWRRSSQGTGFWPRAWLYAAAGAAYGAALLTKESGSVAPALAFLVFVFLAQGSLVRRVGTALARGWILYVLCGAELALLFRLRDWVLGGALRSSGSIFEVENVLAPLPKGQRMANACLLLLRYFGRCVFPLHLSGDESAWSIRPLPTFSPWTVAGMLLVFLLLIAAAARLSQRSVPALGVLVFTTASLPTVNLLFPIGTIFAERLAYLPSIGVCLILAAILAGRVERPYRSRWSVPAVAAVAILLSARTIVRNSIWWTDEGLFTNLVATSPDSAKAHYDVAYVAADDKRYEKARDEYIRATAIYHGYWDAWAGKGRMEKEMGLFDAAERSYEESIAVNVSNENGYFGLGLVREARHDDAAAAAAYREGLEQIPKSLPLAYRLALAQGRLGSPDAERDWKRALDLGGNLCSVRSDYARWLSTIGREGQARVQVRLALSRDAGCVAAWKLASDLAQRDGRRLSREVALERAYRLSGSAEDLAVLEKIAHDDPVYALRWAQWKTSRKVAKPFAH